jgi:hypothetical protein
MTIDQAHIELEISVDKRATSQVPELPPEMKDYFLQTASEMFVKGRYGPNNIYKSGFEQIQKRTEDLKNLVVTWTDDTVPDSIDSVDSDAVVMPLPSDYWFWAKGRTYVDRTNCPSGWSRKIKLVSHDKVEMVRHDPHNKSIADEPIVYFEDGAIKILEGDKFSVTKFQLTYIRRPAKVNIGTYGSDKVEFDLSDHTHKEIVQMAADIIIENVESRRVQTNKQNLMTME